MGTESIIKKIKIKELPQATSINDDDIFIESDTLETYKVTANEIAKYVSENEYLTDKYILSDLKGAANGVAPLNSVKKVDGTYIVYGTTTNTAYEGSAGKVLEQNLDNHLVDEDAHGYNTKITNEVTRATIAENNLAITKADIASPTLTGIPKAPTATSDTNTTQIATTAFVQAVVSDHNSSTTSHSDIRELISGLTTRLNALADSDDTTLDQLSEIVTYIKANRTLIESVTTNKIDVTDIVDNLTSTSATKPLSANQGKVLKDLIDSLNSIVSAKIDTINGDTTHIQATKSGTTVTITHKDISRTNTTSTVSPSHGGTFTAVKSVTSDLKGHVTNVDTETVTLPAYSVATQSASGLESSADKTKLDFTNIAYCTCSTAAATAAKAATIIENTNWELKAGSIVVVKFTYTNTAANPTLDVNGTGAKSIWYNTALITTGSLSYAGYANRYIKYMYDGTQYVFIGWSADANTTYTNAALGQGYGTCATAAATAAKVVTLSSYALVVGGIVAVKFTYAVPAGATLNINSKGAKAIYYRGAAIIAGIINTGDIATFIYDGTRYHLISLDRDTIYTHPTYTAKSSGLYKVTVDDTGHISSATAVTKADIIALGIPASDTDTHYTSKNVVGSSTATSNTTSALTNGNVYLNSVENGSVTSSHKISGSGATTVTTDANGNIVITSTDTNTNTVYSPGTGISISGTTINNSGVRSVATGTANGTIAVNTNGTTANVPVYGLGTAAYTASSDYAAANHTHSYLPLSGGTMTGTINQKNLTLNDGYHNRLAVAAYCESDTGATNNGAELVIGCGGNTFVGSGEAHTGLRTALQTAVGDGETYGKTGERLYLAADTNLYLYSNCQTIANRIGIVFDSSGYLRPLVTSTRSLGSSSYYWNTAYIKTVYGGLDGTVKSTLVAPTTATTYYIDMHTTASTAQKTLSHNSYARFSILKGSAQVTDTAGTVTTAAVTGYDYLILGSNINVGTDNNAYGAIRLYSQNTGYGNIVQASTTSSLTHTLPTTGGTILNTGTTSFTQSLTSGTTIGTLKINGTSYTLYCQTNTDTKVTQSVTTTVNYRPLLMGVTDSADTSTLAATATGQIYASTKIYAQPSTGTIFATTFNGSLSGNATTATTATKLGTTTVGGTAKPIYLSSGTATACSSTVGSSTLPVYMNAGTITACETSLAVSVTGSSASCTGNSASSTYATYARFTATNPTTATTYYLPFTTGITAGTNYVLRGNNGIRYNTLEGTTTANGYGRLYLGNNVATGTEGNKYGQIIVYGTNTYYTKLSFDTQTANRTITFPDATGTVALTTSTVAAATNDAQGNPIVNELVSATEPTTQKVGDYWLCDYE